jgi:hypothetical protein
LDTINELSNAILILINTGIGLRIVLLIIGIIASPDESSANKKRITQAIKFLIIANGIYAIKALILHYVA